MANATTTPKAQEPKKVAKKAEIQKVEPKVSKLDAITSKLPALAKAGKSTSSIYKAELFDGQDDKGKKAIRRKVRKIRDHYVGLFLEANGNKETLKGLQKEWKNFASQVYNNSSFIFEKNTSEEDQKTFTNFVKAMALDYTK